MFYFLSHKNCSTKNKNIFLKFLIVFIIYTLMVMKPCNLDSRDKGFFSGNKLVAVFIGKNEPASNHQVRQSFSKTKMVSSILGRISLNNLHNIWKIERYGWQKVVIYLLSILSWIINIIKRLKKKHHKKIKQPS